MEDYPRNLKEFDVRFRSEEACREYLMQLRWADGFRCPRCGCRESSPVRTVLLRCRDCRHQTSVTAGTIFQDTRTSLRLWFQAGWWMTSQKNGVSASGLQRVLGLHSYETAWTWLHKLRRGFGSTLAEKVSTRSLHNRASSTQPAPSWAPHFVPIFTNTCT